MKLTELKKLVPNLNQVAFQLEDGTAVPAHFHVTEIGQISKKFIDCGGTMRNENVINFQLWNADDVDHRLEPAKLSRIIQLAETQLGLDDLEIEVEYQLATIGKYALDFNGNTFVLKNKLTACLAEDVCGIPAVQATKTATSCCSPSSDCC